MMSLYCAGKFALEGFSEALAYELASRNIAVKLIIPHGGVTATRFSERSRDEGAADPSLTDARGFIRPWSEMSDQDYVNFMRSQFAY
jgi:short-subunit dehydrogenase